MHTSRACLRCDKPHRHAPRRAIEQIQGSVSRASSGWPILRIGEGQRQGIRRCLDTDDYGAASNRLPAVLAGMRGARNASAAGTLGVAIQDEANREDQAVESPPVTEFSGSDLTRKILLPAAAWRRAADSMRQAPRPRMRQARTRWKRCNFPLDPGNNLPEMTLPQAQCPCR